MASYQYITSQGVIVPDTATIQAEVESEFKTALGNDLVVTPDTPQGVLITGEVLSRDSVARNNAALGNQINPNLSGGVFLDALCALTGLSRLKATRSVVSADLTGVPSTIIPAGVQARSTNGDLFESVSTVTLDVDGEATVNFQSVEYGPIALQAGDLTDIVDGVLGWETVTNPADATLGRSEQSDVALRALRRNTLALQGVSLPFAITSALRVVDGVASLSFRENVGDSNLIIEGVTLVPHSVYACVDGGTDLDIATALLNNKSGGCNWNGAVEVTVTEPSSGQPYPVKFARPAEINILIRATVKNTSALVNAQTAVREAILAYVSGEQEGEPGFSVGEDVSPFELASAINRMYPSIYVQKVEIMKVGDPDWTTDEIPITIAQVARTVSSSITVVVV